MKKRILSILLALCMLFCLVPTTAFAEGETNRKVETEQELVDALADSSVDIITLKNDIAIGTTLTVLRKVTLDLNGYVLKMTGSGSVIILDNKSGITGDLTLIDSNPTAEHKFKVNGAEPWVLDDSGTETVYGGIITGGTGSRIFFSSGVEGGGVIIGSGALTMNGGNIVGCIANYGGGLFLSDGSFTMNAGSIVGCSTPNRLTTGEAFHGGIYAFGPMANEDTTGLFFKDTQTVTINAADNSGTVFVSYLVTDQDISEAELQSLVFSGYEEPFRIDPNGEYIVYAMLVDESLNITYLRSDRITLDNVLPVIGGIEDGKTYCDAQTVTVDEKYVDTVTVNGTEVELDESGSFTLSPADGEQRIVVTDKAGNTAEMTVTINDGHTYGEWVSNGDGTHTRQCTVDGCNGLETKDCSGGKATCAEKAVCEVCGKAYGELDPKNHTDLKYIPAKAATEDAEGNIEYWYCSGCGKYYSDKDGTKEIAKADTVTDKLPKSPPTGDNSNLMLWIALLFISGGVVTGTTVISKKKKHSAE